MSPTDIVQKLWNYCNVLRDDGMSYGDYVNCYNPENRNDRHYLCICVLDKICRRYYGAISKFG